MTDRDSNINKNNNNNNKNNKYLGKVIAAVDAREHLIVCGDLNGHVGSTTDGFEGVHGGCGFGSQDILEKFFTSRPDLLVCRTIASTIHTLNIKLS